MPGHEASAIFLPEPAACKIGAVKVEATVTGRSGNEPLGGGLERLLAPLGGLTMSPGSSRREFLTTAAIAGTLAALPHVHAAGSDVLRVGLVGCGDRGTGAATQALAADPNVKLVAMADAFEDRLEQSLALLKEDPKVGGKVDVSPERRFVGFDACQKLLDSGVDVVLLATPPQFRPIHLRAAVEAGKHVFAEKPVAVDAPGVRSVLKSCEAGEVEGPLGRLGALPPLQQPLPRDRTPDP